MRLMVPKSSTTSTFMFKSMPPTDASFILITS
jgi:hypothetical protein